jgi:conjugative relaxase-like TrwC/TraI family protein
VISRQIIKTSGQVDYYLNVCEADYYANESEQPGYWLGKGATILGLEGPVKREVLKNLFEGFDPSGEKALVQNAGKRDRQKALDFAVSLPKKVSVYWAMSDEPERKRIERIIREAMEVTANFLEDQAGLTRRGKSGMTVEKAAIVTACFFHIASRASDPHLHTHMVIVNLAARSDSTFGALHNFRFFELRRKADQIFNAHVALGLRFELGLRIEPEGESFGIPDVPQKLCDFFSKRRAQIKALMSERGLTYAKDSFVAAIETRAAKKHERPEELLARWQKEGRENGWGPEQARKIPRDSEMLKKVSAIRTKAFDEFQKAEPQEELEPWARLIESKRGKNAYVLKHRRWGNILWKKDFGIFEIRVQMREPFSKAWGLNPASKVKVPSIRIVPWRIKLFEPLPPHKRPRPKVLWQKNLILADLKLENTQLFPWVPRWSPLQKAMFPRLKLRRKSRSSRSESESQKKANERP